MVEIVYNVTAVSYGQFVDRPPRPHDRLDAVARSREMNFAESSKVSGASRKKEMMLVGVARASLEERLLNYQDFLEQKILFRWKKAPSPAKKDCELFWNENGSYFEESAFWISTNAAVCLIRQNHYHMDQQHRALEKTFIDEGGFTARLFRVRS